MRSKLIAVIGALMLSASAMQAQTGATTTAPIDINTASRTQLADAGWGQYADAIIAARPYKSMNDLVDKKVVPQNAFDKSAKQFTIANGETPLSSPNASPTLTQPPVTPPTATPGTPPTVTPGTTPSVNPGTTPSVTPGQTPSVTPGTAPTVTPGTAPTVNPGATPAAPAK